MPVAVESAAAVAEAVVAVTVPPGSAIGLGFGSGPDGVIIGRVDDGLPAAAAGLRRGLCIRSVCGRAVGHTDDIIAAHAAWKEGGEGDFLVGVEPREPPLDAGDACFAFWGEEGDPQWLAATVRKARSGGTYDVEWEDGSRTKKLVFAHVTRDDPTAAEEARRCDEEEEEEDEGPRVRDIPAALQTYTLSALTVDAVKVDADGTALYNVTASFKEGHPAMVCWQRYSAFRKLRADVSALGFGPLRVRSPFPGKTLGKAGAKEQQKRQAALNEWMQELCVITQAAGREHRGGVALVAPILAFASGEEPASPVSPSDAGSPSAAMRDE